MDQSGRGYFIEAQGDKLLVGGLLYSESGQPAWFTASGTLEGKRTFSAGLAFEGLKPDTTWAPGEQAIKLEFVSPWRAILSLGKETPVEIRRYRPREIGWAGLTPEFTSKAVVSAASFRQGITPGGIVSIYGTGLTRGLEGVTAASSPQLPISLQGTSVTVNGRPAPLYSLSRTDGTERIDFQVPYELAGQKSATVMVMNNGAASAAIQVDAFPVHPALFTTDGSHLVALRANGTPATAENAPMSGETISVFGAGLGPVTPVPETDSPAPSDPPSTMDLAPIVHFNAKMAEVVYAGLAPGVAGLYRIDLIVPDRVGIGDLTFYVNVSGLNSNVVKIPVQSGQFR